MDISNEYAEDQEIDENALDLEWLDQARLAYKWGKIYADLKYKLSKAIEMKKVIRSEIILYVNKNPERTVGKAKPNKDDIEAWYRADEGYKAVVQNVLDLEREVEYAEIAKNEISFTRKKALENMVVLHGQQYFAGPRVPRNLTEEREKRRKEINSRIKIGKGLKRNK